MRFFLLISFIIISYVDGFSQGCCSGGVGSPIAGGVATGVMQKNQLEFSFNYQINSSDRFYNENTEVEKLFNKFSSEYLFLRSDFGVNKRLTLSLAAGYFLNKFEEGIKKVKKFIIRQTHGCDGRKAINSKHPFYDFSFDEFLQALGLNLDEYLDAFVVDYELETYDTLPETLLLYDEFERPLIENKTKRLPGISASCTKVPTGLGRIKISSPTARFCRRLVSGPSATLIE